MGGVGGGAGDERGQRERQEKCAPGLVCASDPTTVAAALMKAGYQGLVTKADDGDPSIESAAG